MMIRFRSIYYKDDTIIEEQTYESLFGLIKVNLYLHITIQIIDNFHIRHIRSLQLL